MLTGEATYWICQNRNCGEAQACGAAFLSGVAMEAEIDVKPGKHADTNSGNQTAGI